MFGSQRFDNAERDRQPLLGRPGCSRGRFDHQRKVRGARCAQAERRSDFASMVRRGLRAASIIPQDRRWRTKLLCHIGDKLDGGLADPDRCEARVTDQGELQRKAEAIAGTATGFDQRNVGPKV